MYDMMLVKTRVQGKCNQNRDIKRYGTRRRWPAGKDG